MKNRRGACLNIESKTLKIVRITPVFSTIKAIFKGQNQYLSNNGCKVFVISSPDETARDIAKIEGFEYYPVRISRGITPYNDIKAIVQIINILNKIRPDLVHTHTSKGGFIGMTASFAANIPHRIHSVAGWSADSRGKIIGTPILLSELATLKLATRVIFNSESLGIYLLESGYISNNKGFVLGKGSSNGVDIDRFQMDSAALMNAKQVREKYGILKNDIVLAFIGRVMIEKGIKELLDVFLHLINIYSNIHLLIIGSLEEDSRKGLPIELVSLLNNHSHIHLTGWVDDVPCYLAATDILIHPSYHEGMPNALLQGAAMEIPCVASNVRGNKDAIIHGVTGYLYQPHNTKELINLLIPLIDSPSLRISLGKEGRQLVEREFDKNVICKRLLDFYYDTLAKKH
jgi:glycosyltransferase involved in cell wall biosynthesis